MIWNRHFELEGRHAFLSASKYHWINYDEEKLANSWRNYRATERGTELHAFASQCIKLGQKLPRSTKALNAFVNDAITYKMQSEQVLYYSDNCYGTADAICFDGGTLRIHDYKSGEVPAHMEQLMIYAALFCLEYRVDPHDISTILRIYQGQNVEEATPSGDDISAIMEKIVGFDNIIDILKAEEK